MQDEGLPARHCKAEDCFAIFLHLEVELAQKLPNIFSCVFPLKNGDKSAFQNRFLWRTF